MQLSKEDIILFIVKHDPSAKSEELVRLSLTDLVIIKTRIEIEIYKK
jgi:hypothetical protein